MATTRQMARIYSSSSEERRALFSLPLLVKGAVLRSLPPSMTDAALFSHRERETECFADLFFVDSFNNALTFALTGYSCARLQKRLCSSKEKRETAAVEAKRDKGEAREVEREQCCEKRTDREGREGERGRLLFLSKAAAELKLSDEEALELFTAEEEGEEKEGEGEKSWTLDAFATEGSSPAFGERSDSFSPFTCLNASLLLLKDSLQSIFLTSRLYCRRENSEEQSFSDENEDKRTSAFETTSLFEHDNRSHKTTSTEDSFALDEAPSNKDERERHRRRQRRLFSVAPEDVFEKPAVYHCLSLVLSLRANEVVSLRTEEEEFVAFYLNVNAETGEDADERCTLVFFVKEEEELYNDAIAAVSKGEKALSNRADLVDDDDNNNSSNGNDDSSKKKERSGSERTFKMGAKLSHLPFVNEEGRFSGLWIEVTDDGEPLETGPVSLHVRKGDGAIEKI